MTAKIRLKKRFARQELKQSDLNLIKNKTDLTSIDLDSVHEPVAKKRAKKVHPDREKQFLLLWKSLCGRHEFGDPVRQHVFHPVRKWRFDFAWPAYEVAVEIDGGVFQKGPSGHRSIDGRVKDMEKDNEAQVNCWIVLRYSSKDLDNRPAYVIGQVLKALKLSDV